MTVPTKTLIEARVRLLREMVPLAELLRDARRQDAVLRAEEWSIRLFNQNHGPDGRFAVGDGGGEGGGHNGANVGRYEHTGMHYGTRVEGHAAGAVSIHYANGQEEHYTDAGAAHAGLNAHGIYNSRLHDYVDLAAHDGARYMGTPTADQQARIDATNTRRAELDQQFKEYTDAYERMDAAARAAVRDVYRNFPEVRAAVDAHIRMAGLNTHLSVENVAQHGTGSTEADRLSHAAEGLRRLSEISEWSLLHSDDVTREGTIRLFHGANDNDVAAWEGRLQSGLTRGTPFTDDHRIASTFAHQDMVVSAHVPASAVMTWHGIRGDQSYAREHEYTVDNGVPITDHSFLTTGAAVFADEEDSIKLYNPYPRAAGGRFGPGGDHGESESESAGGGIHGQGARMAAQMRGAAGGGGGGASAEGAAKATKKLTPEEATEKRAERALSAADKKASVAEGKAERAQKAAETAETKLATAKAKLEQLDAAQKVAAHMGKTFPAALETRLANARKALGTAQGRATAAHEALAKARDAARAAHDAASQAHAVHEAARAATDAAKAQTPEDRLTELRSQVNANMAHRDGLYAQQSALVAERDQLETLQSSIAAKPNETPYPIARAELRAKYDIYHQSLDQSDPAVKRYLKNAAADHQLRLDAAAAGDEMRRLERVMDTLALAGKRGGAEWNRAQEDYKAAEAARAKANKDHEKVWHNLWTKSPGVYMPELDSIAGFEIRAKQLGLDFSHVGEHPLVVAARERIATLGARIMGVRAQIRDLERPIRQINVQIDRQLAQLHDLAASLHIETQATDTLRPFSAALDLPEGHQPPTALMSQLDYHMNEPRAVTKARIIDDINSRLRDNPAWQEYVARMGTPELGKVYHQYIPDYASARDTRSAQQVADLIKRWGVGYRAGSKQWVAMQMAVRDEFGLDAQIHGISREQLREGEEHYAKYGQAYRAFMRAMYDNTQSFFAAHGITEVDVYRGMAWHAGDRDIPRDITWGSQDEPTHAVGPIALNPYQSWSADINISAGTTLAGGFGGGFAQGKDYQVLVGARVPVERVLSTAQTGFGAKLESEMVIMGRATDTVGYRASTRIESALLRQADEHPLNEREHEYRLADGTHVHVRANEDHTFTVTLKSGRVSARTAHVPIIPGASMHVPKAIGAWKEGASRTYKTEAGVNQALRRLRLSNTYTAPIDIGS